MNKDIPLQHTLCTQHSHREVGRGRREDQTAVSGTTRYTFTPNHVILPYHTHTVTLS